jgi:hypothetical protein
VGDNIEIISKLDLSFMVKNIIFISLLLALAAHAQQQRVAIMGTEDDGEPPIAILELTHLTAKFRELANNILPKSRYGVMTQQSIVDRLGSQEQAVKLCREATCLADLGRKVNADYIAQARIGRFSGNLTIRVELYNVASGNLIASFTDDSENAKGLLAILEAKAPALFKNMPGVSGGARPAVAVPGGITVEEGGAAYAQNFEKRYLVDLSTEPKGAILSFNGVPISSCTRTPCKAELPEGEVRIIAALDQHETADTSVFIMKNNQSINIRLKSSFGVLRIEGAYRGWNLTINDKPHYSFENKLSPGTYEVKLKHDCYEDINFKAGINKGANEVFDMSKHVQWKQGVLELSAEQDGKPVSEPVYADGKRIGETPFSGYVPVCANIEIGENREAVDARLRYKDNVKYTHKMGGGASYGQYVEARERPVDVSRDENGVKFGVRVGFSANKFSFGYNGANEGKDIGFGYGAGLMVKVPFTNRLGFNAGLDIFGRELFSGEESMSEVAISIPVMLQFTLSENGSLYLAAGVQLDIPNGTEWDSGNDYSYLTERRVSSNFGLALEFGYVIIPSIVFDVRCVMMSGLFEDFENSSVKFKDRSSLMQFGFGTAYFF